MPLYIYNSLTRKKEEFVPLNPPDVNMYTCGVTVYDQCHIGHARSLYIFDVIRRFLKFKKFKVKFVRNITDIDDKIINRSFELKVEWKELVEKYISEYYDDLRGLGIPVVDAEPCATDNIEEMIEFIRLLIEKGFAYEAGGDVYFNVRKFSSYGKLSGQSIEQLQKGVRIEPSELKKDHLDFSLWKRSKEGEPFWESPWGKGRPGWHIECSVMSQKFLKTETLDIHAGGRDLIFPHHENEIAQAEALTGKPFAKYWIHHGLLTINGQKMAKSSGNFVTIKDFLHKYHDANILKIFFLSAHYSHPIDYTENKIEEARLALERITILLDKLTDSDVNLKSCVLDAHMEALEELRDKFIAALNDDFNMPQALAAVFEMVNMANKHLDDVNFKACALKVLHELLDIFGISLHKNFSLEESVLALIEARERARKEKDFLRADEIRKELERQGIVLEDAKEGTTWRRRT